MTKTEWTDFLTRKIRTQISREAVEKVQTWAFSFLGLIAFGFALGGLGAGLAGDMLFGTKILFLVLAHLLLIFGVYLPDKFQKNEKPLSRLFQVRDITTLTMVGSGALFYAVVVLMLSWQVVAGAGELGTSGFFKFVAWSQFLVALYSVGNGIFYFLGFSFFPAALLKAQEQNAKSRRIFLAVHASLFLLLGIGYHGLMPIGSTIFFEQFRVAALFWIFIISSLLLISRLLGESAVAALTQLELEVVSGKLDKHDDILARYKDCFVPRRLVVWVAGLSYKVATEAHEIFRYAQEAISLVSRDKPSEIDLRQVEDRHKRADQIYRRIEKENLKFLVNVSFFDLEDTARLKIEDLKDQFSRELRHAKLELAGVRKRIDDKLTSLKENILATASDIPIQEVPLKR